MRVAIFGGSFDPPHIAHQMAALWARSTGRAEEILWVPCFRHAYGKIMATFEQRFEMCRLALSDLSPNHTVSRVEAELGGESRTVATLRRLRGERPSDQFSILIGADLVEESRGWLGYDELCREASFIVAGRAGYVAGGDSPELPRVSSSDIRLLIRQRKDVSSLVPASVLDYIEREGLYRAQ